MVWELTTNFISSIHMWTCKYMFSSMESHLHKRRLTQKYLHFHHFLFSLFPICLAFPICPLIYLHKYMWRCVYIRINFKCTEYGVCIYPTASWVRKNSLATFYIYLITPPFRLPIYFFIESFNKFDVFICVFL